MRSIRERARNLRIKLAIKQMTMDKRYKKILKAIKGIHNGDRCFIIGNGPSLTPQDLDKIKNEYSFATNKIYYIFPKTKWRPTFFCASDNGIIAECIEQINQLNVEYRFLPVNHLAAYGKPRTFYHEDTVLYREKLPEDFYTKPRFSKDITKGITSGFTVTYIALQLAVYMGFTEIYLLGVDHGLPQNAQEGQAKKHFYTFSEIDKAGVDFEISTASYQKAKEYAEKHGIKIYNATRGGNLEVFERVDIDLLQL